MTTTPAPEVHLGRNIKRLREMLRIKQEALAITLGDDWNQKKVSRLEEKENIDDELLKQVADALHVTPEAIKNFDEAAAVNYFNTFNDNSTNQGVLGSFNDHSSFILNPVEKWVEALEEIKKLNNDKVELLERMLKDKNEMIEKLEGLLKGR